MAIRPLMGLERRLEVLPVHVRGIVRQAVSNVRLTPRSARLEAARAERDFWGEVWASHGGSSVDSPHQRARLAAHYFCAAEAMALADADRGQPPTFRGEARKA